MTAHADVASEQRAPNNPFVGPRPFRRGQLLPNRAQQAEELADLLVAERVVLLHAPSGAGKTSLIQAAVVPLLEGDASSEPMAVSGASSFRVAGPVRVGMPAPPGAQGNRYIRSIALQLSDEPVKDPGALDQLTLATVLDRALPSTCRGQLRLLVIDQLEEVLILDPTDWAAKKQFFRELGAAVTNGGLWVLLAIREDYMGGLDRYLRFLPGHLRARYRLDFLTKDEARAAITAPADHQGVTVSREAADVLVEKLAKAKVEAPGGKIDSKDTPYVEPFQLQVVCRRLWKDMRKDKLRPDKGDFRAIEQGDVEKYVDVDHALRRYYADSVAEISTSFAIDESAVRDWFEYRLITEQGFRSQTDHGPRGGADDEALLRRLTEMYLVNSTTCGDTTSHELAHDRLIPAVIASNRAWRHDTLPPWRYMAHDWQRGGRQKAFLLSPQLFLSAPSPKRPGLTGLEREFLEASKEEAGSVFQLRRYRATSIVLFLVALAELAIIVFLVLR